MSERPEATAANGLPERKSSMVRRAVVILPTAAVLAMLTVACSEASSEPVNIREFECETSGFKLIDDGEGHVANQLRLKLSSDVLTDDLEKIFREEQLCVVPKLSLRPNSFTVRLTGNERDEAIERRDEAIERFEEELGSGVEEVAELPSTRIE